MEAYEDCLADGWLQLGHFDRAIAEYRRVLAANPKHAIAHYRLGVAYSQSGRRQEARAQFQRFLEIWKDADADVPELTDAHRRLRH